MTITRTYSFAIVAGLGLIAGAASPVVAQPRPDEQHEARRELRAGNVHALRDIERQVLPTMPGTQYLGSDYFADEMTYRLKFIRDGRVMFIDVDARTGQVLGQRR